MGKKHGGKTRKCWLPAFSRFSTMFSKGFFLRVIKSRDSVVKSYGSGCMFLDLQMFGVYMINFLPSSNRKTVRAAGI